EAHQAGMAAPCNPCAPLACWALDGIRRRMPYLNDHAGAGVDGLFLLRQVLEGGYRHTHREDLDVAPVSFKEDPRICAGSGLSHFKHRTTAAIVEETLLLLHE